MSKKTIFLLLLTSISTIYAQKEYSQVYNNESIIKNGVLLHEKEDYTGAIKEFDKISKNDPKYIVAQYEKALSLSGLEKKDELNLLLEELYKNNKMVEEPNLYILYASYLSDEKKFDEAEKIFKEGEKIIPNSTNLLYNYAVLHVRKEERQKAVDILKKVVTLNPNSASAHYLLGLLALEDGKIVEGSMAILSYLMISPNGSRAKEAILKLNAKFGENYLEKSKLSFSKSGDNFEELETILRNQLPLRKAYKIKCDIDDVVTRQVQAIVEYAGTHKIGDGFFETTYLPWIKSISDKNQIEAFSYYILIGMEEDLGKKLTSKKKLLGDFYANYYEKDFWNLFAKRKLEHFGSEKEVIVFLNDGKPFLIGNNVDGKSEGKYKLVNEYGNTTGELNFKNDELDGTQKYYNDKAQLTTEKTFANGKLNGQKTAYYENGNVSLIENYKDDKLQGITTSYYLNGGKSCEINYTEDERDGKFACFYANGTKKEEVDYTKGKLNGKYIIYNALGDIIENYIYKDGELNGNGISYYDGKKIKSEANYLNGKTQGTYKSYFSNGVVEREVIYENNKVKKTIDYYSSGKKSIESLFDDKEIITTSIFYNSEGLPYFQENNKAGELKTVTQFSRNNAKPEEISLNKKPFVIKNLDGKILSSGDYEKGKRTGDWKYYYTSGILKSKRPFKKGNYDGVSYFYDKSGELENIANYVNDTLNGGYETYSYGKLTKEYNYENGKASGPYKIFYTDGKIQSEGFYQNDEINFERKSYFNNGNILKVEQYTDGEVTKLETYNTKGVIENTIDYKNKSGKITNSYYNGTEIHNYELSNGNLNGKYTIKDKLNSPIYEGEFINGIRNNVSKSYSPNGTLSYEVNYYAGKKNGLEKTYDLAGNLRLTDEYTFGDEHGKTTRFYQNKSKLYEYSQFDGSIEGEYIYYNLKGEPVLKIGYINNAPAYYIKKNSTGELNERVEIKDETATIVSNYANGKTAMKIKFVKGNREELLAVYNDQGKPEIEMNYKNDILNGNRTEYYANGNVYKKETFVNNDYNGTQEYYKEDGKLWLKADYKNDELHGNFIIYTNGTPTITKKYDSDELIEIVK